jgi:Flp pilus assembly protein CpaB
MRIFLFIFAALVAAGGTGFYLFKELGTPVQAVDMPTVAQAPKTKEVFVPAVELAAGSILRPEQLGRMAVGESIITPEMIVADDAGVESLVGSVAFWPRSCRRASARSPFPSVKSRGSAG